MAFSQQVSRILVALGCYVALTACAGLNPSDNGGSGPPSLRQTASSLDSGNSVVAAAPVSSDGNPDPAASVPSTQETLPALGAGCRAHFRVKVHVLEGPMAKRCDGMDDRMMRIRATQALAGDTRNEPPPPPPPPGPRVTLNFMQEGVPEPRIETSDTECASDGSWQTKEEDLRFYYASGKLHCTDYKVQADASWDTASGTHSSNTFQGPPFDGEPDETYTMPIDLRIDLGTKFLTPVQTYLGR